MYFQTNAVHSTVSAKIPKGKVHNIGGLPVFPWLCHWKLFALWYNCLYLNHQASLPIFSLFYFDWVLWCYESWLHLIRYNHVKPNPECLPNEYYLIFFGFHASRFFASWVVGIDVVFISMWHGQILELFFLFPKYCICCSDYYYYFPFLLFPKYEE